MMKIPNNITFLRNETVEIGKETFPVLLLDVIPGESTDPALLKFDWSVK
jgi:hypothetical protein